MADGGRAGFPEAMGRALGGVFSKVTGPAGFPRGREEE